MSFREDYDGYFEADYPFGVPGDVWRSKNGEIPVSEMTEDHIKACMRIVGEDDGWYGRFARELNTRNEMSKYKTCELITELKRRDGVNTHFVEPYENFNVSVNGPAVILVVVD